MEPLSYLDIATSGLNYLGDQRDPKDQPKSTGPKITEKYGIGYPTMRLGMALARVFSDPIRPRSFQAWGVSRQNIPTSVKSAGLNFEIPMKGAAGGQYNSMAKALERIGSTPESRQPFFNMVARKTKDSLLKDRETLTKARTLPKSQFNPYGGLSQVWSLSNQAVMPGTMQRALQDLTDKINKGQGGGRQIKQWKDARQRLYARLRTTLRSIGTKTGKAAYSENKMINTITTGIPGGGRNPVSAGTERDLYFNILNQEIANLRGDYFGNVSANAPSQFAGYVGGQPEQLQEQSPVQEQPTREQSLAKNAFKGIGIGSAIVRNVFNLKRLPRPDLGWGQKLFSRQY